ncbi:non-ribosomal peptide synthetase [Kangiella sp.]|uniref:non-ribosomal peptide synthetase n=1 Tax=Kangiella sp. TaxID=1920245 RepID=UPI003A93A2D4
MSADEMELLKHATATQKGLYYIQKSNPSTAAYNLVFAARVINGCELDQLQSAVSHVQKRHTALRSVFCEYQEDIYFKPTEQVIQVESVDLSGLTSAEAKDNILNYSRSSFALEDEVALKCYLFQLTDKEQVLLFVAHHSCFDFWSLGLFLKDVSSAYSAVSNGELFSNDDNCEYNNYLDEDSEYKKSDEYKAIVTSLAEKITMGDMVLNMSTDFPRPTINSFKGESIEFRIPGDITARLLESSKALEVTPYTLLLASYCIVLHSYTGQDEVLVGTPVSGRDRRKYHKAIGNFVNTIVLSSSLQDNCKVSQFISETASAIKTAVKNQKVSFPDLVAALKIKPDPSRSALVQAGFAWDKLPGLNDFSDFFNDTGSDSSVEWGDLLLKPYWLPQQEGQYDINIEMGAMVDGELCVSLKYRDDLFKRESMHQLGLSFTHILDQVLRKLDSDVSALELLPELHANGMQSVVSSNIELDIPKVSISDLIETTADNFPNRVAVQDETSELSYDELSKSSTQLSQYLCEYYSIAGKRVGVSLERNKELIITLLAIMKAGAAYVPIDPNLPMDRAQMIVEDGNLCLIINDSQGHSDTSGALDSVSIQELINKAAEQPCNNKIPAVAPDASAYVIFTSGSTGRPKGVEVSHRNVVNMLRSFAHTPGMSEFDSLLAVTTISFDISVLELFLPLSVGAKTIILGSNTSADASLLIDKLNELKPSWMQATPATWKMLVDSAWQGIDGLTILCGGENLPKSLADDLSEKCSRLFNVYGPTETTVWSTLSEYQGAQVDIGTPIANTTVMILNKTLEPVPLGVVGDIYIAGDGLTKGYFNRNDLTEQAYLWSDSFGDKIYQTGDVGRLTHDRQIECLGRRDNQLKIRGFRIELSDIEENFRKITGVKDAVVVAEKLNGELILVGYFVSSSEQSLTGKMVKAELKHLLPYYMIPNFINELDRLPLNSNGKVDRKQLPNFDFANNYNRTLIEPSSDLERQLLELWQEVLNQESISVDDDFYDIGGHSLLAMKLIGKINEAFNLNLNNQFIFSNTTIEAMASAISHSDFGSDDHIVVPLNKGHSEVRPLHLLHPIGGTIHCYMALNQYLDSNIPVFAYQSPGIKDADEIEVGIEDIASKYVERILINQPEGPFRLGGWCFGGVLAYESASQLKALGHDVEAIHVFDTRAPIVANHPSDGDDATLLSWFARDLAVPHNKTLDIPIEILREIEPEDQFEYVLDRAREINILDADTDVDSLLNFFQVYIANGMALQMYEEKRYDLDVYLYRAEDEPEDYGEYLGWDSILSNDFSVVDIPGDHNSIMYKPNVHQIAEHLNQHLMINNARIKKAS